MTSRKSASISLRHGYTQPLLRDVSTHIGVTEEREEHEPRTSTPETPAAVRRPPSIGRLSLLTVVWFGCSALCSLWSHLYLRSDVHTGTFVLVSTLTLVQVASCAFGQMLLLRGKKEASDTSKEKSDAAKLIGTFHFLTTWFMNACMASSDVACASTIRGVEPLLAACVAYFWLPQNASGKSPASQTPVKILALFLITGGVFASTWSGGQCRSYTFAMAGLSGALTNVFRNAVIQTSSADAHHLLESFGFSSLIAASTLLLCTASQFYYYNVTPSVSSVISLWLPGVGISSMIYNSASITVCAAVPLVTHSLLTVLKRPVSVVLASAAGGLPLTQQMIVGNVISAGGLYVYSQKSDTRMLAIAAGMMAVACILYVTWSLPASS